MAWFKWSRVLALKEKGGLGWQAYLRSIELYYLSGYGVFIMTRILSGLDLFINRLKDNNMDLMKFLKKRVGNGHDTSFWEDVWRGDMNFKSCFPRLYALETDKKISVADKLNQNVVASTFRRSPRNGVEMEQYSALAEISGRSYFARHVR
ncbi:hypothetical protein Tco_0042397 [Tanacetum coccineum]